MATSKAAPDPAREGLDPDPFWYKTGVIYELHVRAFCDSDGNGIGDFQGLTSKLDYLRDLGVTALWLLPFYPSPLRDDGYDIADYYGVHPNYGNLDDFRAFLDGAHQRGLRVITELVLNHTSDQHPWFQRARRAPAGTPERDFYVWSDSPKKYRDARIIFKDVEVSNWTWDHVAKAYYWHRFFSHQPDLNYDNELVFSEMVRVLDFWLDLGVDGLRLDAVPYLYERENTSCENLPQTHEALKKLRAHVDARYGDRMLLGEANQWPEDAVAYFGQGQGDECHMAFHFPLMPRLFMALRLEDRTPIVDILEQTPPIPATAQWALFLRNHDELTLEMVTDEERDYMYRMYAHVHQARLNLGIRRRLAPLLGNDRKRIELLNALLFSLPGTPVLYYGDEIGMGENIYLGDRNGVRTPMQWSSDKNAGFSRANPQALYLPIIYDPEYHYEAVNVEAQLGNPHSLLWWMRRLLALRKKWRALGEGKCEFLQPQNRSILSYILRDEHEILLVVANLSRFVQPVELDLKEFGQRVPVELFGRTEFPRIQDALYPLTLGPHSFYWFSLQTKAHPAQGQAPALARTCTVDVAGQWSKVFSGKSKAALEVGLPEYLRRQDWFLGKTRTIKEASFREWVAVAVDQQLAGYLALVKVDYVQGEPEVYALPLAFASGEEAQRVQQTTPRSVVAQMRQGANPPGVLYDGSANPLFCRGLLDLVLHPHSLQGTQGEIKGSSTSALNGILGEPAPPVPTLCTGRQRNSCVQFGDKLMLKLFRRLDDGTNPELEISRFLTQRHFPNIPPLAGAIEYLARRGPRMSLGIVYGYVTSARDGWQAAVETVGRYYDRVGALHAKGEKPPALSSDLVQLAAEEFSVPIQQLIGTYLEAARLLGARTAAMHLALSSEAETGSFSAEPFTPHYVRGLFQTMRVQASHLLRSLRAQLKSLPAGSAALAEAVLARETELQRRYRLLVERPLAAKRIRIHGDFRLDQVLWTGRDFIILDFEGDPASALSERCIKRSPLRDVAGMIRSFHYAAEEGLEQHVARGSLHPENVTAFGPWMAFWTRSSSAAFLRAYLSGVAGAELLPSAPEDLRVVLEAYLLSQAIHELGGELTNNRPRLKVPLEGIWGLLDANPAGS